VLYNNIPLTTIKRIEYQQGATHASTPPEVVKHVESNRPAR
jgi:hypothetical protein